MQPFRVIAAGALVGALAFTTGCHGLGVPSSSSPSVKKGELGNGGFTFKCDDSVACDRYNNADTFPTDIAQGSNFELDFFLRADAHGYSYLKEAERGTTIEPIGKFIKRGPSGFGAVESGVATISARDQKGWLVDYITVYIRKPTSLVVYEAGYTGDDPQQLSSISLNSGERRSFRTVARSGPILLAGTLGVEWSSDDKGIVAVEGYTKGKVTVVAQGKGTTQLVAKAAGIEQRIDVTVEGDGTGTDDAGTDAADASSDLDGGDDQ